MKLRRLFIGRHTELTRPVYNADERLMRRIAEARRRLGDVQVKPVSRPLVPTSAGRSTNSERSKIQRDT